MGVLKSSEGIVAETDEDKPEMLVAAFERSFIQDFLSVFRRHLTSAFAIACLLLFLLYRIVNGFIPKI